MMRKKSKCAVAALLALTLVAGGMLISKDGVIISKAANVENSNEDVENKEEPDEDKEKACTDESKTLSEDTSGEQTAAEVIDSGTCGKDGDNLTWVLTSDGTLTISGTGEMTSVSPWNNNSDIVKVKIEEGVTSIGDSAFSQFSSLEEITIPDSMISIEDWAFGNCSSLTSIHIPENVIKIGKGAFYFCSNLSSVTIPEGVTHIEDNTFWKCSSLTSISMPESVTRIGEGVFYACSSLTDINIPENVTSIGSRAFENCSNLVSISMPERIVTIGDGAFRFCSNLMNVSIPESITEIEKETFYYCSSLTSISIPENVTSIGDGAFDYCSSLANISMPESMVSIGKWAFGNCSNLTSISIPESVTSIGEGAFQFCSSLKSMTVPERIVHINNSTFWKCSSLVNISIPENLTSIGSGAFSDCSNLTSINIPKNVTSIGSSAFLNCSNLKSINIPEGVTSIGAHTFSGCSSLTNLIIPEGVTSIGGHAFWGCSGLVSISIPEEVVTIDEYTFGRCSGLRSIHISKEVDTVLRHAFTGCDNLQDVYYSGSKAEWEEIDIWVGNENLTNATIHYNGASYNGNLLINTLIAWDENTQTASFDTGISYHIDENTDLSFLDSLDELLGKKVLVVGDRSEVGLLKGIYPVEEIRGSISEWSASSITLNGTRYPAAKDYSTGGLLPPPDTTAICYLHDGVVVGIIIGEEKTGTLEEWNGTTNELTIDGTRYPVKTDDLSFLPSIQSWLGKDVEYVLLDGTVIQISLPDYSAKYTAKLELYDEVSGILSFSDGKSYTVSEEFKGKPEDYIGKWVVCTTNTSQDKGTYVTSMEAVITELEIKLQMSEKNIYYKDGKYGFDEVNYKDRSDLEIPYTLSVQSKTNADKDVIQQLKNEGEYDLIVDDLDIEIPSGFNFGWLREGDIQGIAKGTVLHAGDVIIAKGCIRPSFGYSPQEFSNTYSVKCILKASAEEYSSEDTFTITESISDASSEKLKTAAAKALDDLSGHIAINNMTEFFDNNTSKEISRALLSVALMAKAEQPDLKEALTEELFSKVFGEWKLKTGANTYNVPVQIAVNTEKYGELIFKFTMHMTSFQLNGADYGVFGNIDYEIIGGKGLEQVPQHMRSRSNVGVISKADVKAFCDAAYELAEKAIKGVYDCWGKEADNIADMIFGQTVKEILKANDTSFSKIVYDIITSPTTEFKIKCPVDVYLYNKAGELCASIVNDKIEKESDLIHLELVGDTKIITVWEGSYDMKLVSNGSGDMDVTITEYAGRNRPLRTVDFYDITLGEGIDYSMGVYETVFTDEYILTDKEQQKIVPDQEILVLETAASGDPEEHVHLYGEPEFSWSKDNQTCTAVFICNAGDDEKKVECRVTSESTDPTCTVAGKKIYTATAEFKGEEYTEAKEEIIPALGHAYEYKDNGDGTHTKVCTEGDEKEIEAHVYEEEICTLCGVKEHEAEKDETPIGPDNTGVSGNLEDKTDGGSDMKEESGNSVETGDENGIVLWGTLLALVVSSGTIIAMIDRKKRYKE